MIDSKNQASKGIVHGTVFRAGYQNKGRGRLEQRSWVSSKGKNLMFTLVLERRKLELELNFLPLAAGAALLFSCEEYTGQYFSVKWPNDLYCSEKKIAGILCEADESYLYCGIGINCNQLDFPEEIRDKTGSLKGITGRDVDMDRLLSLFLKNYQEFLASGDLWRRVVEQKLYKKDLLIELRAGQAGSRDILRGINRGIGDDGELLLEMPDGSLSRIYAGEIEL